MDMSRRRAGVSTSVVAGSVWESRMKNDEVKGGIMVFSGGEENTNDNSGNQEIDKSPVDNSKRQALKRGPTVRGVAVSGKRKTWKSENPIQIARGKTEIQKNGDDQCKELSVSTDGIKLKSPVQVPKGSRSELKNGEVQCKELSVSVDGIKKSPIRVKKGRSESVDGIEKSPVQVKKERSQSVEGNEKSPIQIRKPRSEVSKGSHDQLCKEIVESGVGIERNSAQLRKAKSETVDGIERNSVQLRKVKSESNKALDDPIKSSDGSVGGSEKIPIEIEKTGSDENCKEFGVCQEKVISSTVSNVGNVKSPIKLLVNDDQIDDDDYGDGCDQEFDEEEEEEEEEAEEKEKEIEIEKKSIDVKEVNVAEEKPSSNKIVNGVKKLIQFKNQTAPFSSIVNEQPPPVIKRATTIYSHPTKPAPIPNKVPVSEEYQSFPQTQNKLQSLVDLVMWRDVSKSAFVFGIGTFIIISSSYTKDLNISFISVISYLGLVYLAAKFLHRSIICRGIINIDDTSCVLGEEEAVWLLKLVLPYLNEFLLKIRALFSGDPATTMKLAVLLFVLARSGSSITIWKMAKLGFFGVFTVPKICCSYSAQLTAYAKFWIRRFRDAWDSCSHKKAVAIAIFTLVWNLSSIVARVWAAFMLFVALRYYQQSMVRDDEWVEDDAGGVEETSWQEQSRKQRKGNAPTRVEEANKIKKGS